MKLALAKDDEIICDKQKVEGSHHLEESYSPICALDKDRLSAIENSACGIWIWSLALGPLGAGGIWDTIFLLVDMPLIKLFSRNVQHRIVLSNNAIAWTVELRAVTQLHFPLPCPLLSGRKGRGPTRNSDFLYTNHPAAPKKVYIFHDLFCIDCICINCHLYILAGNCSLYTLKLEMFSPNLSLYQYSLFTISIIPVFILWYIFYDLK